MSVKQFLRKEFNQINDHSKSLPAADRIELLDGRATYFSGAEDALRAASVDADDVAAAKAAKDLMHKRLAAEEAEQDFLKMVDQ